MFLVVVIIIPIQRLSRESRDEGCTRRALDRQGVPRGADGIHDPTLHQHLHDCAASICDSARWARMARSPTVGQLRGGVQGSAYARAALVEHIHRHCRRARVPDHLDDGRVRHWPAADPRRGRAPLPVRVRADTPIPGHHHPNLLPGAGDTYLQHPARYRAAADRLVYALCRLLDARPLCQYAV